MKKIILLSFYLALFTNTFCQGNFSGESYNSYTNEIDIITYNRELFEENQIFTTAYTIFNKNHPIYRLDIKNYNSNLKVVISISNLSTGFQKTYLLKYDSNSGIICDTNNFNDNSYSPYSLNDLICSFQDTNRTFLYINKFKDFNNSIYYETQKLSTYLINKHMKQLSKNTTNNSNNLSINNSISSKNNIATDSTKKLLPSLDNDIVRLIDSLKKLQTSLSTSINDNSNLEEVKKSNQIKNENKSTNDLDLQNPFEKKYLSPSNILVINSTLNNKILNILLNSPSSNYEKNIKLKIKVDKSGMIESIESDQIEYMNLMADYYLSFICINLKKEAFIVNYANYKNELFPTNYYFDFELDLSIKPTIINAYYDGESLRDANSLKPISNNLIKQINNSEELVANKRYILTYCNYTLNNSSRQKLISMKKSVL